jgi:hypothetical protein
MMNPASATFPTRALAAALGLAALAACSPADETEEGLPETAPFQEAGEGTAAPDADAPVVGNDAEYLEADPPAQTRDVEENDAETAPPGMDANDS